MKLENIFNEVYLKEFYLKYIKTKPNIVGVDKIGKVSYENKLFEYNSMIARKVLAGNYMVSKYRGVLIPKQPNKPPRTLAISTIKDRIVLSLIKDILQDFYYKNAKQELIQSKIDRIKSEIEANKFDTYIKVDIIDFFPSIPHDILLNKLSTEGIDRRLCNIINKAISKEIIFNGYIDDSYKTKKIGVPQGLPISNILAEIYMSEFDTMYLNNKDICYFRYVDDILILCKEEQVEILIENIYSKIESLKLSIHDFETGKSKKGKISDGFIYLGYKYENKSFTVKNDSVLRLEKAIVGIFSKHQRKQFVNPELFVWELNVRITGLIVETKKINEFGELIKKKYGWLFFFSQIDDLSLLYHLDFFVMKLIHRYNLQPKIDINLVKRFVKAYNHIRYKRHETNYIPNYSDYTIDNKKELLKKVFKKDISKKSDNEIESQFEFIIYKLIKDLEEDVQYFS